VQSKVFHIGFAGSRLLYGSRRLDAAQTRAFDAALLDRLVERLAALPARLGLSETPPPCGVSQVAIGADTLFSMALQRLGWPHRVLLPQAPDDFLAAGDPGDADFTDEEQAVARALLAAPNVKEVRVASASEDRIRRFEDTNNAILRASDAVVCLLREGAAGRPGGTHDLMQRAQRAGKPALLLEVSVRDGQPRLSPWAQFSTGDPGS
jgi:hypothetical protein